MFEKVIDEILSRWFRDGEFRQQLRHNPEKVLAGYELTPAQRTRLLKLKKQGADHPVNLNVQNGTCK